MKKLLRETVAFLLLKIYPGPSLRSDRIVSVFFHNPPVHVFENVIRWLAKKGYEFISTDDLYEMFKKGETPSNKALITLDDGWQGNLRLLLVIEKYKTPITIFVSTGPVVEGNYWWEYAAQPGQEEITGMPNLQDLKKLPGKEFRKKVAQLKSRYHLGRSSMTQEEVQIASQHKLVTIGAHTVTHPILHNCTEDEQLHELSEAKKVLESWTGRPVHYIAYPNGDYNKTTLQIVEKLGYRLGFTVEPESIDLQNMKPLEVPRTGVEDHQGYYESISKAIGAWYSFKRRLKNFSKGSLTSGRE